jgi:S1-C subfamily serine protease
LLAVFVFFKFPRAALASRVGLWVALGSASPLGVAFGSFSTVTIALSACAAQGCAAHGVGSVGAMLGKDVNTGRLFVREVPPGMAAATAGIREGDEVIAIDGAPVADLSPSDVHQRLEGTLGSTVTLLIVRDGETRKIDVVRAPLEKR